MKRYILRRVLLMIPTILGAGVLVFFLIRVIPGDICLVRWVNNAAAFFGSSTNCPITSPLVREDTPKKFAMLQLLPSMDSGSTYHTTPFLSDVLLGVVVVTHLLG